MGKSNNKPGCRNCNRSYGPGLVSENDYPPPLDEVNLEDGVNIRLNARVEFGSKILYIKSAS